MKHMKFAPELVPLVQDGTKTVTRRPIKPQPKMKEHARNRTPFHAYDFGPSNECYGIDGVGADDQYTTHEFPYGPPGTIIQSDAGPLEIVSVKVERLHFGAECKSMEYAQMWDGFYGDTEYCWSESPWVWVIEFKAVTP